MSKIIMLSALFGEQQVSCCGAKGLKTVPWPAMRIWKSVICLSSDCISTVSRCSASRFSLLVQRKPAKRKDTPRAPLATPVRCDPRNAGARQKLAALRSAQTLVAQRLPVSLRFSPSPKGEQNQAIAYRCVLICVIHKADGNKAKMPEIKMHATNFPMLSVAQTVLPLPSITLLGLSHSARLALHGKRSYRYACRSSAAAGLLRIPRSCAMPHE